MRTLAFVAVVLLSMIAPTTARPQTISALGESILVDHAETAGGVAYDGPHDDEVWLHVSVSARRLTVWRGRERLHAYPVGVGTGGTLRKLDGGTWTWDTPTGIFEIGRKKKDPVWYAPDWHYLERGLPVPSPDSPDRYMPGVLGDYALYLSEEIAIHGTRDADSVGRASSHGCLRMTNADITVVFELVQVGTRVIVDS